jgi:predicted small metal-binding protein
MERINKKLGAEVKNKSSIEENKVNKLRQRINELRGVYV